MAAFRERFNNQVTKAYVSDSNQFMVAYWSVYGDFSATLYNVTEVTALSPFHWLYNLMMAC
jgi:hypothetical protein